MKKSLILALVAVFATCAARASVVTPEEAREVAVAWSARNAAFGVSAADVGAVEHVADTNGVTLWYQVQMGTACLIVAPVTEIEPVIAALENVDATQGLPAGHPMLAMLTRDMTDRLTKLGLYQPQAPSGGATLQGAARAWSFPAGWNMVRLVGRGENIHSGEQFHVTATSHGITLRLK